MPRSDIIDFTGKRIGEWTVLEYAGSHKYANGSSSTVWKCQCSCGIIKNIGGQYLRKSNGYSKCAKCALNIPKPGQKFGDLIHTKDNIYKCTICGNKKKIKRSIAKRTGQCGCMGGRLTSWKKKPRPNIQPLTTTDRKSKILNMWLLGYTGGEIGKRIGLSRQRISILIDENLEELGMK